VNSSDVQSDKDWRLEPRPCPRCQTLGVQRGDQLEHERWCGVCQLAFAVCVKCGTSYTAPMSPYCKDGHAAPLTYHPFIPYFDFALGVQVNSLAERKRHMRNAHVDYRDKPSKSQLSERAERKMHERQERDRGHAPGGERRSSGRVFSR
jgi:hypothetical protein